MLAGQRERSSRPVSGCARTGLARQAAEQARPVARAGPDGPAAHAGSAAQAVEQARRMPPGCRSKSSPAAPCRAARRRRARVAPHASAGNWRSVLERDPRAVGDADEVDALGAERAPHRIEVLHRDRRREEAEVALRLRTYGCFEQRRLACAISRSAGARARPARPASRACRVLAGERRRAAGAALVDEDDVAPVVQAREQRHHLRRQRDRALPRAAGEHEHRVGQLPPRQRRHDDVVDLDIVPRAGCAGSSGRCTLPQSTPLANAGDAAFAQRARRGAGRRRGRGASRRARPPRPPAATTRAQRARGLIRRACASARRCRSAPRARRPPPISVALDEHHREGRPAGPHLQRVAPPPFAEVAAVLEVVVGDAGGRRAPCARVRTTGLPAMPTTSTGFEPAAAWTLWTMSAFRLATLSRIAGCRRASSRIVRGMAVGPERGWRRPYHRRDPAGSAPRAAQRAAQAASAPRWKSAHRLVQLGGRVHDERPVLRDRLAERPAGDQQHARRPPARGRGAGARRRRRRRCRGSPCARLRPGSPRRRRRCRPRRRTRRRRRCARPAARPSNAVPAGRRCRARSARWSAARPRRARRWLAPAITRTRTPPSASQHGHAGRRRCRGRPAAVILSFAARLTHSWKPAMRPASCSGISEWMMPRPAVIHCTLPGSSRPTLPTLSRWRMRPSSMIVTVSKPRCGWSGKPPM